MEAVKRTKKQINMTEGPLFGKIVLFVLPLMATNLLQMFYNAADMMVVSLSPEANAVGAIGVTNALINLVLNVFMGFSVGGNVVVARRLGAGDAKAANRTVHTALLMGMTLGFLGMAIGLVVCRPALSVMGATDNLLDLAAAYTRIYFLGVPFMALTNFTIAIFRAKGDTRTPLFVLSGAGLLNVGLNLFFVLVTGLSVEGVAIATAVANAVSALVLLTVLARDPGPCRFSPRRLCMDKYALRDIVLVGIPAGVQGALFSFSNIIIQSSILQVNNALVPPGETYQPVISGHAASGNLEGFSYTATNAVHQAAVTFTGQNAGAEKYHRVWRVMGCCYLITTVVAITFGYGILLLNHPLLALYGVEQGEAGSLGALAYQAAMTRFRYMFTVYFLLAWMEIGSGVLRGLGKSLTSAVISFIGACLFRIVWIVTVFRAKGTLESIYLSYPLSWGITAAFLLLFCVITLRRHIREQRAKSLS